MDELGKTTQILWSNISLNDNKQAFRELHKKYFSQLCNFSYYFLKSKELSEEAVSDVYFNIWQKRKKLVFIDDIVAYMYVSVKNQSLHYLRRGYCPDPQQIDVFSLEITSEGENPEETLLKKEFQSILKNAIEELPEKCKIIFKLVRDENLRYKQVAQILNLSVKTVETQVSIAYRKIAENLKGLY